MHSRRLSALLLGGWLVGAVLMNLIAWNNLRSPGVLVQHDRPGVQRQVAAIGSERMEALLRFQASELNRSGWDGWEIAQAALGFVLVGISALSYRRSLVIAAGFAILLVLVLLQHFVISPRIVEIGRGLDFSAGDVMVAERGAFASYEGFYRAIEVGKFLILLALSGRFLITLKSRHRRSSRPVDNDDDDE